MISEGLRKAEKAAGREEQQRSTVILLIQIPQHHDQVADTKALPLGGWGSPAQEWTLAATATPNFQGGVRSQFHAQPPKSTHSPAPIPTKAFLSQTPLSPLLSLSICSKNPRKVAPGGPRTSGWRHQHNH